MPFERTLIALCFGWSADLVSSLQSSRFVSGTVGLSVLFKSAINNEHTTYMYIIYSYIYEYAGILEHRSTSK